MRRGLRFLALSFFVTSAFSQQLARPPIITPKNQKDVLVFGPTWEAGEMKDCSTYDNQPYLLVCDEQEFKKQIGNAAGDGSLSGKTKGMTEEDKNRYVYHEAFRYALFHSKTLTTQFSEAPWPSKRPKDIKLASWHCTKDKLITCKLVVREH